MEKVIDAIGCGVWVSRAYPFRPEMVVFPFCSQQVSFSIRFDWMSFLPVVVALVNGDENVPYCIFLVLAAGNRICSGDCQGAPYNPSGLNPPSG